MYNEAMRGRLNEEVAILAVESGGRMHSQFYRLITAFAEFKADKVAGPLNDDRTRQGHGFDNCTDPAAKAHKAISALQFRTPDAPEMRQCQTKSSLGNLMCFKTSNLDLRNSLTFESIS